MHVKTIIDEWFQDYKKPSMFIGAVSCCGKCCIEAGIPLSVCQNNEWRNIRVKAVPDDKIAAGYLSNAITQSICIGGLEPMEQFDEVFDLIKTLRNKYGCNDDIVIYTGYYPQEIADELAALRQFENIVVKFGRYQPGQKSHYDEVLGVELASDNQWAERIS